jgi:hypothetical protein
MADSSLSILRREGEQRGAVSGHDLGAADFDEHLSFYKGTLRFTRIFLALMAVLLLALYFFFGEMSSARASARVSYVAGSSGSDLTYS